jgi:hypothetical protein
MRIAGYETHPAADLFPMMEGAELQALADDIKAHGLHNPIVLFAESGKRLVLDGRNRLKACEMVGVSPMTEFWVGGEGSPTEWVVSQNLHRRHLTTSQRAIVAAGLVPMFEKEAHARLATSTGGAAPRPSANLREAEKGKATEKAAKAVNVSPRIVESAVKVTREAPSEVVAAIRSGEMTVHAAEQEMAAPRPRCGSPKDQRKEIRGDMWRVPRSPSALAGFLRRHWTTREWRSFMAAVEETDAA